jgi:hypothetical protein
MAEAGGDDNGGRRAFGSGRGDDRRHCRRRHRDHHEIGRIGQIGVGFDRLHPLDRAVVRIDQMDGAFEAAADEVRQHGTAGRSRARTGADDGDGSRRKQLVQSIGRHRSRSAIG